MILTILEEGSISLASKIPLMQSSTRMLRLLLKRVFSLDPVSSYPKANMEYSLLSWYCVCCLWVFYTILYYKLTWVQVPAALLSVVKRLEGWIVAAAEDMYSLCGGKQDNKQCFIMVLFLCFVHHSISAPTNKCY